MMQTTALLLVVVLAVALGSANAQTPLGSWQTGRSTFYQGIDGGNCGFGGISSTQFPFRYIAAPNTAFYADAKACGKCFEVKCTSSDYMSNACLGGSVIVEVTDQCPCAGNERWCCGDKVHFDMSPEAFSRIANTGAGVINTQFRPVTCPVSGNLRVQIKDGANQWWFALLASNVGGSGEVTNLEVSDGNNGQWTAMQRQSYNYWIATSGAGFRFPLGVRVSQNSKVITGTIPYMSAGAVFELTTNFA